MTTYPVRATFVEDVEPEDGSVVAPGSWSFYKNYGDADGAPPAGMLYACPCGCGQVGALAFRKPDGQPRPSWIWNGSRDAPTLEPSVHHIDHWHGWLRNGEWTVA